VGRWVDKDRLRGQVVPGAEKSVSPAVGCWTVRAG
jgi:hypothetical protein